MTTKIKCALVAVALMACPFVAWGGPYHLYIEADVSGRCSVRYEDCGFNTCSVDAVLRDINQYIVQGRALEICTLKLAFDSCALSGPREPEAKERFYTGLVAMLTEPELKKEHELIELVGCLRNNAMRGALKTEMLDTTHSIVVRKRLESAWANTS